jgi:hypothetical protein
VDTADALDGRRRGDRAWLRFAVGALVLFALGFVIGRMIAPPGRFQTSPSPTPSDDGVAAASAYPRTEAGAIAAATDFASVMAGVTEDADAYEAALAAVAAPEWKREAQRLAQNTISFVNDRYGNGGTLTFSPVRYRLTSYTADAAVVKLWGVTLASGPKVPGIEESWITGTVNLIWVDGEWRVNGQDSASGPTPELLRGDDDVVPETVLKRFREYEHVPRP